MKHIMAEAPRYACLYNFDSHSDITPIVVNLTQDFYEDVAC